MLDVCSWSKSSENQLTECQYQDEDSRLQSQMNDSSQQITRKGSSICQQQRNLQQEIRYSCRTPSQPKKHEQGPLKNNLRTILRSNILENSDRNRQILSKQQVEQEYEKLKNELSQIQFINDFPDMRKTVTNPVHGEIRNQKINRNLEHNTSAKIQFKKIPVSAKSSTTTSTQYQQKKPIQVPLRINLRNILKSNFQERGKEPTQGQTEAESKKDKIRKEITELQFIPPGQQSLDLYAIGKSLGVGATAEVKMAKHKIMDLIVAIKIYDKKKMSSQSQKNLQREIEILSKMNHPNIIRLYHAIDGEKSIHLVMEYTSPTCLNTFMRGKPFKRINEDEAKIIFRQIVDSVCYIHNQNILHRDMKLENVLIDYESRKIKLIDFGYSVEVDHNSQIHTSCGTPSYMPPEIVRNHNYSFGADVWSCGVILYKLLTGVFPFRGNSEKDLFKKICLGKLEFPSLLSQASRNILCQMLRVDQYERNSIFQVAQNPWFDT